MKKNSITNTSVSKNSKEAQKKSSITTQPKKIVPNSQKNSNIPTSTKSLEKQQQQQKIKNSGNTEQKQTQQLLQDSELNQKATEIAQKENVYKIFQDWFFKNGGKINGIEFPAVFGNSGYLGVAASQDIPANTSIISVPKKLLISTLQIVQIPELSIIIEENPEFFDDQDNEDGEFNKLALFLIFEKQKGFKSFWKPYLDVCENPITISQWDEKEIDFFQESYIKQQSVEYITELNDTWMKFEEIAERYPEILPKNSYNREIFIWAFETVMTRCFGFTLPGTYMVPMADFFNHSKRGCMYFMTNNNFENNPKQKPDTYKYKKGTLDISLIDEIKQTPSELKAVSEQENQVLKYLESYRNELNEPINIKQSIYKEKEELLPLVRQINSKRINLKEDEQIWNQIYFSTTEDEENDSDPEDESLNKNEGFNKLKQVEQQQIAQILLHSDDKEQKQQGQEIKTIQINQISQKRAQKQERYLYELQDDEWDWFDPQDEGNYLNFVTSKPSKKGQQLFHCYGRRTSRFLMLWYGFCFLDNPYNSVNFRLLSEWETQDVQDYIVYTDYISYNDWEEEKILLDGTVYPTSSFTKEFRLKKSCLCEDFLTMMRVKLLKIYKESDFFEIKVTIPTSFKFELQILDISLTLLEKLKKQMIKSPIEEDIALLSGNKLTWKQRFAVIYRKEYKEIILIQIQLVKLAILILQDQQKGLRSLKQSYMKKYPEIDSNLNEEESINLREKIRNYLRQVNFGIVLRNKNKNKK